jgi:hypothetical protein
LPGELVIVQILLDPGLHQGIGHLKTVGQHLLVPSVTLAREVKQIVRNQKSPRKPVCTVFDRATPEASEVGRHLGPITRLQVKEDVAKFVGNSVPPGDVGDIGVYNNARGSQTRVPYLASTFWLPFGILIHLDTQILGDREHLHWVTEMVVMIQDVIGDCTMPAELEPANLSHISKPLTIADDSFRFQPGPTSPTAALHRQLLLYCNRTALGGA